MRLFWELCQRSFQRQLTYRAATFAGLLTNFFFGLLRAAVMVALYGARTQVAGYSLQNAITYTGLSQATIGFVSLFSWAELMKISLYRHGPIISEVGSTWMSSLAGQNSLRPFKLPEFMKYVALALAALYFIIWSYGGLVYSQLGNAVIYYWAGWAVLFAYLPFYLWRKVEDRVLGTKT